MINNLTPDQLKDIHHMFYYCSGRKTTLEDELKQVEQIDITKEINPALDENQYLLMKAAYDFAENFTGHGFFYIPIGESVIDDILDLAFAGLHPQRYISYLGERVRNDIKVGDLPSITQKYLDRLVSDLDGTEGTITVNGFQAKINCRKERDPHASDVSTSQKSSLVWRFDPKDDEGYCTLGVEMNIPQGARNSFKEIENAVYVHFLELLQFTYGESGLLERFPLLEKYVSADEKAIIMEPEIILDKDKVTPGSLDLYFKVNFLGYFGSFILTNLQTELGCRQTKEGEEIFKIIPKDRLFDICNQGFLGRLGPHNEMKELSQSLPRIICDQVETLLREAYPKAIAELEEEAEKEDDNDKEGTYRQLVSLYVLSNLDKAYEYLSRAVRLSKDHNRHFFEWDGGFKTIK